MNNNEFFVIFMFRQIQTDINTKHVHRESAVPSYPHQLVTMGKIALAEPKVMSLGWMTQLPKLQSFITN